MISLTQFISEAIIENLEKDFPKFEISGHKIGFEYLYYCKDKETGKLYIVADFMKGQGKDWYKIFAVPEDTIEKFIEVAEKADKDKMNYYKMNLPLSLKELERLDDKIKGFENRNDAIKFLYKNILKY